MSRLFQNEDGAEQPVIAKGAAPFAVFAAIGHAPKAQPLHHKKLHGKRRGLGTLFRGGGRLTWQNYCLIIHGQLYLDIFIPHHGPSPLLPLGAARPSLRAFRSKGLRFEKAGRFARHTTHLLKTGRINVSRFGSLFFGLTGFDSL
jgi:hypothetical protein